MKKIIITLGCVLVSAGCNLSTPSTANSNLIVAASSNPIHSAAQRIGLNERSDRQELKDFLEVDPVRTEWCAAFVNSVLEESGIVSNKDHKYPLTARAFLDWGNKVNKEDIQPGDIVIFPRGNQGWQGHVGFYISTIELNGIEYYAILGGNQNDKVSIDRYRSSAALGIRRNLN
jgi:uncharacterized protein (TIGR02594 family)